MKTLRTLVAAAILGSLALVPAVSPAQRGGYRPNGGNWRQQGWRRDYRAQNYTVRQRIDRAERASNAFRHSYETSYDRRDMDRFERANHLKASIQRLDEAFERLRDKADDRDTRRGRPEMEAILRNAREIDRLITRTRDLRGDLRPRWNTLRDEIDGLAWTFGLRPL